MNLTIIKDHVKNIDFLKVKPPILIIGPAFCGKSELAQSALDPAQEAAVIGTGDTTEKEYEQRVTHLKGTRSRKWETFENVKELSPLLAELLGQYPQVLLDSLNQYIASVLVNQSNRYSPDQLQKLIQQEIQEICHIVKSNKKSRLVIVTNEVAAGVSPPSAMARLLRQTCARANAKIASQCQSVASVTAGIPMLIKSTE